MKFDYKAKIGRMVSAARLKNRMTQTDLAAKLGTSQSAVGRIEKGKQNISLEMLARISDVLSSEIVSLNDEGTANFRVRGGRTLHGSIEIKTSKNAAVSLLCASLLNEGKTILRRMPRIEEVNRIIEVLESIGVKTTWLNNAGDLAIVPPRRLELAKMNVAAAKKTRSIIMLLGALSHKYKDFKLPFAGGCSLGKRTVAPHLIGLKQFGMNVGAPAGADYYHATVKVKQPTAPIVLVERGDTVTENLLMAAALNQGETVIRNASSNYMVQDLCFYLEKLGVRIDGVGSTVLKVQGLKKISKNVEYFVSEDPIEAMSFAAAAVVTGSEITIKRAPIEFLEVELATLKTMGLKFAISEEYLARNGRTRLVDLTIKKSRLTAPADKLTAMPFPGINLDNLPFMALIATVAEGRTLVHDWAYENRAIYLTDLNKLGAAVELVDP
ncbi:MAG: helix-turn-helix domain-containing protein, partial [Candidatus Nomurabacteria bacterium]|nr:helix-turn-helix domain-containing protein [Candidatus Nomurabacteria bacterium]